MLPLLERVAEQYSAVNQGAKSRGLHALINLIQSGHVLGDNDVPDEDAGGFEYAKDYNDDDDDGDPEIRRKHGGGDREIMAAARNGQILVFSDSEDEDSTSGKARAARRKQQDEEAEYNAYAGEDAPHNNAGTEGSDEFMATGTGGKRVFKRGVDLPSVDTSDLYEATDISVTKGAPGGSKFKPQQPKTGQPRPSPRRKNVKGERAAKKTTVKTISAKNSSDHRIRDYERGRKATAMRDKRQEEWMVGKRKVKMKIKKAPKTVQGDIDAAKAKREMQVRAKERAARERQHREQQVRRRMRIQFERKLAFKKMYRRRGIGMWLCDSALCKSANDTQYCMLTDPTYVCTHANTHTPHTHRGCRPRKTPHQLVWANGQGRPSRRFFLREAGRHAADASERPWRSAEGN